MEVRVANTQQLHERLVATSEREQSYNHRNNQAAYSYGHQHYIPKLHRELTNDPAINAARATFRSSTRSYTKNPRTNMEICDTISRILLSFACG